MRSKCFAAYATVAQRDQDAITGGVSTPGQVGQVSPDGRWRWDGTQWLPTGQPGYRPPRPGSRGWPWLVAGGCVWLMVVSVMLGVVAVHVFQVAQRAYASCLPADFPAYPSAHLIRSNDYVVGTGLPEGDSHQCAQTLETNDGMATVNRFYASHLDSGDWKLDDNFALDGPLGFHRISRPATAGTVQFRPLQRFGGLGTRILISLDS